ncbi:chromatin-remodeling ATPase INO80 [Diorhabda sublineata]|uniref:chromatin-remodeling ATPase INO80 n=1 Tax=Diorhabda sublineata TaxID=1163346 RepID=UPI0024E12E77|nr:chromatin-remodeling ATPase INO80 [Diorhabda sublineata]
MRNSGEKTYKILPNKSKYNNRPFTAKPIHIRRIEQALDLNMFFQNVNDQLQISSDSDDSDEDGGSMSDINIENILRDTEPNSKEYYNLKSVSSRRKWLADILLENNDSTPDDVQYKYVMGMHSYQKFLRKTKDNCDNYRYYGAGLISAVDQYPEIEKNLPVSMKKHKIKTDETSKSPLYHPEILDEISDEPCLDLNLQNGMEFQAMEEIEDKYIPTDYGLNIASQSVPVVPMNMNMPKKKAKKFRDEESRRKWEDMMTIKRKKLFTNIVKKEIGKQHRSKINKHKEMLLQCKRVASHCVKYARQKALQSARIVKEQQWRMKRLARENIAYWKRSRRFDREVKKRLEKEAEEQRKIDHELVEAKRQQRKLNFLITQTELYAHFMSKKLGQVSPEEQLRILSQLDEESTTKLSCDNYDSEGMKELAKKNAMDAFQSEKARTRHFDDQANSCLSEFDNIEGEHPQPEMFRGKLKGYQLRGMNWLANLYSQGISGILADEMGLGKTVQSIAFLCHIAEKYSVWGPFLIISPASTLHNWQQELAKFVPDFKVVPYWGNPNERKILRQFWDQKDMYTKDASFHIVVTSYQIVITDIKYFNRIKWQYMILDEAQAIKSTSSMRWKTLLGFSCRNRLLLSGTPIQNSMAELWALLHFIMPTLFDSHEEFNEWFSKDIESHAENKTGIDEKHLSRLHMILKPFMLRRIKKDVENELSDKIEVMVYCPLTTRQNLLYLALKQKIKIEDLLHYTVGGGDSHTVDKNFTSNLMNLVMQFRKVCNHPELFERRDAKSPIRISSLQYNIPYLLYDYNVREVLMWKLNKYFVFTPEYISKAIGNDFCNTIFNFCLGLKLSFIDIYKIFQGDVLDRWRNHFELERSDEILFHKYSWNSKFSQMPMLSLRHCLRLNKWHIQSSIVLYDLIFTRHNRGNRVFYSHTNHLYHSMPETVEHKNIRLKTKVIYSEDNSIIDVVNEDGPKPIQSSSTDFPYIKRETQIFECTKTEIPAFLFYNMPRVASASISLYCYSRRAAWDYKRHVADYSFNSLNYYWSRATNNKFNYKSAESLYPQPFSCVDIIRPTNGWSNIVIPDKESLVTDSGKLSVLDGLLRRLKEEGHRVLIYSQMTKMIDLLEEYMWHRHHKYMRLDGSSKISERRDMVADFQARTDIFVFLLSTRAGGLGINLTAADTVIFYDSDWNPTVDQQAMDRAHRLGQTKQVTVYRLICKGSIEERILQRAREKSEIQKLVISGGNFKPDTLKPKEVVSLLLDDDELVQKYHLKIENPSEESREAERKRKLQYKTIPSGLEVKRIKVESSVEEIESAPNSPRSVHSNDILADDAVDIYNDDADLPVTNKYTVYNVYGSAVKPRTPGRGSSRRGRPRGSRSRTIGLNRHTSNSNGGSTSGVYSSENILTDSASSISSSQSSPSSAFVDVTVNSSGPNSSPQTTTTRRGPGRPRLKPGGPSNAGSRGTYRPRKPARPLPVPLPSDGTNLNSKENSNAQYSSYSFYDFPDD